MINYDEMYDTPESIRLKFEILSNRLGVKISLREDLVNYFGYQFLYTHKDIDKVLFYFKMNVENYPQSSNAFDSLGEVYVESGDKLKAIENYEKALQLDQNNVNSKMMIKKLKSN